MTLISYAQNFEDVMLWRALKHVENGFYVDVGAQDPVVDSVSLAFYEHGWRGVHIEPIPHYAEKLRKQRPDEIVIQAAIGATPGALKFFEIPDTGLSTGNEKVAEQHRAQNFDVRETVVSCLTITQALEPFRGREIHWMKVDVEGLEREVIEGWETEEIRPWVVVIESTTPLSQSATHHDWEFLVLKRGYEFAYFDGLNRYYVSTEHHELLASFDKPPNCFDDFVLSGRLLNEQIAARDAENKRLNAHIARQQGEWDDTKAELAQTQQQLTARDAELAQTQLQLAAHATDIERLNAHIAWQHGEWDRAKSQLAQARQEIDLIYRSLSWRLTKPLRWANGARRSLFASIPRLPEQFQQRLHTPPRELPRLAALWLMNRPRLAAFVRRALARFPTFRSRLRQHFGPDQARSPAQTKPGIDVVSTRTISDRAARVLQDLRNAMNR
jgi:FkbM family methyltransferase